MCLRTRNVLAAGLAVVIASYAVEASAQALDRAGTRYEQRTGRDFRPGEWVFVPPLVTVFRRPRPELDPLGIRAGSFVIEPELALSVAHNDNIFADAVNEIEDTIYFVAPSVRAASNWNTHLVGAEAYGRFRRYDDNDGEDADEYGATLFGRVDIEEVQSVFGSVSYSQNVEGRATIENAIAVPVEVRRAIARLGYSRNFARGNLRLDVEGRDLEFSPASERDRDRQELGAAVVFRYDLTPRIAPFVRASFETREYDLPVDFGGFNRDSDSYELAAGARIEISDIMLAEVALGGTRTNFSDPAFSDVTTFSARGDLTWNITTLTSLIGRVSRTEEATTLAGVSSKSVTAASLRAEHELLRTLLLYLSVRYLQEDFRTAREDDIIGADAGAEWLLNRWLTGYAEYHFDERDSNIAGQDFTNNTFIIGARLRY